MGGQFVGLFVGLFVGWFVGSLVRWDVGFKTGMGRAPVTLTIPISPASISTTDRIERTDSIYAVDESRR